MPASKKVRNLVNSIVDKQALSDLKRDPKKFGKRFNLSPRELKAIKSANLLIVARFGNPLLGKGVGLPNLFDGSTITTHTITITGGTGSTGNSGVPPIGEGSGSVENPQSLDDLSKVQLIDLVTSVLTDVEYAAAVKAFLGLP